VAALPPLAQMVADMDGPGSVGASRRSLCVHGLQISTQISCLPLPLT
jgi:hypothetical protein